MIYQDYYKVFLANLCYNNIACLSHYNSISHPPLFPSLIRFKVVTNKQSLPIYAESVNMMERLDEEEENQYFDDNPKIIPLFEIDILQALT